MEETFFEMLERTKAVDYSLAALAILLPVAFAAVFFTMREKAFVRLNLHYWTLAGLAGPVLWIMWMVYNRIEDHYGLDSVFALLVNLVLFLIVAVLTAFASAALAKFLRRYMSAPEGATPTE